MTCCCIDQHVKAGVSVAILVVNCPSSITMFSKVMASLDFHPVCRCYARLKNRLCAQCAIVLYDQFALFIGDGCWHFHALFKVVSVGGATCGELKFVRDIESLTVKVLGRLALPFANFSRSARMPDS